jgi:hypothetical protein
MEQGKDIISIDKSGKPCAFQLKGGDIDGAALREYLGETNELVMIPINFPGIPKGVPHRAVFVTNGTITDKVRRDLDDLSQNYENKGFPKLEVKTKLDLVKDFLGVNNALIPSELADFKLFLELLSADGHDLVNKQLLAKFFENILLRTDNTKLQLKREIASSLLLTEYILGPYSTVQNYVSVVEGWTVFGSYILSIASEHNLPQKYWLDSYNLVIHKVNSQLDLLKEEFLARENYFETTWDGGEIIKSRLVIVLGWLSAYELYRKYVEKDYVIDNRIYEFVTRFDKENALWYWGESATPFFLAISKLVWECGDRSLSNKIIGDMIALIANENGGINRNTSEPFTDPYYGPAEVIGTIYNVEKIDCMSFLGLSYHIGALVDIMVRRNERKFLEYYWKNISSLRKCEFNPSTEWKLFMWICEEGEQIEQFYDRPQSWAKLVKEVADIDSTEMHSLLENNPFSYYFLLSYPHRLTRKTAKLIEK